VPEPSVNGLGGWGGDPSGIIIRAYRWAHFEELCRSRMRLNQKKKLQGCCCKVRVKRASTINTRMAIDNQTLKCSVARIFSGRGIRRGALSVKGQKLGTALRTVE